MKKIILSLLVIFSFSAKSQTKAMTEDGREVVLFDNKTWKFVNESDEKTIETIDTNNQPFEKATDATFLAKSKRLDVGLYYNPKKWKIIPGTYPPYLEHAFNNSINSSIYGLFGSEKAPIQTLKNLKELVISSVQRGAQYFRLKESEYRTVNGIKVLYMKYSANSKGLDFEYMGNYYLTSEGYCSITVYTFANQYEANKNEMETFINGIVKAEKATEIVIEAAPPMPMPSKKTK